MSYTRNISPKVRFVPSEYPLSAKVHELVFGDHIKQRQSIQSGVVSPKLCDDIFTRLSPYLNRNKPLDILDLWPGNGLLSSKLNDYLQPRHHLLIEQDYHEYKALLNPLAKSKPCYKLLAKNPYLINNWTEIFSQYLPEQKHGERIDGELLKNDSLLVLANPPAPFSNKDHFTPARWWSAMMEQCLALKGFNVYGTVRILAIFALQDSERILPRTIVERKRPAIVSENVAEHMFEVGKTRQVEAWMHFQSTELIKRNFERVAEREKEQGIVTPESRKQGPYRMAIPSPRPGKSEIDHQLRFSTPYLEKLYKVIAGHSRKDHSLVSATELSEATKPTDDKAKGLKWLRAYYAINRDNVFYHTRATISEMQAQLDKKVRYLSQAAADPSSTIEQLKELDRQVATAQNDMTKYIEITHYRCYRCADHTVDDDRNAALSNNLDDSCLLFDRRPFEPLHLSNDEFYPHLDRTVIYFEAAKKPIAFQKAQTLPFEEREQLLELFNAYTSSLGTRSEKSVAELVTSLFPGKSINELVQTFPGLALYAVKRLKDDSGPISLGDGVDPHKSFQENLDYDLTGTRIRLLPVDILWDMMIKYLADTANEISSRRLTRLLGGTLTAFRAGESVGQPGKKSAK